MTYAPGGEVVLTASQMQALHRLLEMLSIEQVEQLTQALADVVTAGHGSVTIRIKNKHPWIIDKTVTDKMELKSND